MPQAATPFRLRLGLLDPAETPVQDAVVTAEFRPQGGGTAPVVVRFEETEDAGVYESRAVTLPQAGSYDLLLRDQTYRQEEAQARLVFEVDGAIPARTQAFVFPPTDIGSQNVWVWLLYLIALPLGAAVVVTLWVLLRKPETEASQA